MDDVLFLRAGCGDAPASCAYLPCAVIRSPWHNHTNCRECGVLLCNLFTGLSSLIGLVSLTTTSLGARKSTFGDVLVFHVIDVDVPSQMSNTSDFGTCTVLG